MTKVVREIIITLLICLAIMLILAIALYQWIPSRKVIPEVKVYAASSEVKDLLEDDIMQRSEDDEPVLSYSVTSSDLNDYQRNYDYVPGKPNPFSDAVKTVTPEEGNNNNGNGGEIQNDSSKIEPTQPSVYSTSNGTK